MEKETLRDKFYQIYPNLPEGIRDEIIVVIDGHMYTWKSAEVEIQNDTELAKKILQKMDEMELI